MDDSDGDTLSDLPPSAKLVFKVLEYKGPMTQKDIVGESMLSARTVRYALERLEDIDAVTEDVYFADARQNLYEIDAGAVLVQFPLHRGVEAAGVDLDVDEFGVKDYLYVAFMTFALWFVCWAILLTTGATL